MQSCYITGLLIHYTEYKWFRFTTAGLGWNGFLTSSSQKHKCKESRQLLKLFTEWIQIQMKIGVLSTLLPKGNNKTNDTSNCEGQIANYKMQTGWFHVLMYFILNKISMTWSIFFQIWMSKFKLSSFMIIKVPPTVTTQIGCVNTPAFKYLAKWGGMLLIVDWGSIFT